MGMDLVPTNDIAPFHCNWSAWTALGELLVDAGADIGYRAGSNDGDEVPAAVARSWAEALTRVVEDDTVIAVLVEDSTYAGGWRIHLRTEAGQVARPVLAHQIDGFALQFVATIAHLDPDRYAAVRDQVCDLPPCGVRVEALGSNQRQLLDEAIAFFRDSGGFTQH